MFLLDTGPLGSYLQGRGAAVTLISPWIEDRIVATTLVSYGEVAEYLLGQANRLTLEARFRRLLQRIEPLANDRVVMDRYAVVRRQLRPPYGPGLIGDLDTIVAATALVRDLTLVTTDSDFRRVPDLKLLVSPPR